MLADKLEAFVNIRRSLPNGPRRHVKASETLNDGNRAKGNRTLLGTDFLSSSGLVLNVKNACWYFWGNPTHKYPFGRELDTPSIAEKMSFNTRKLKGGKVKV
ncbi:hypothetical protein NPIL_105621 [Nephila pilipes]|uniref:Uncharacterized protein n=1 Tax=Nephila pilipes TaxID=299642 RepID=A0A8X6M7C5_NEPPI|nr:hypothetical protein NPIL_105621 [Nephila pilipes]